MNLEKQEFNNFLESLRNTLVGESSDSEINNSFDKLRENFSNSIKKTMPMEKTDSEIFSFDILEKSWQNASLLSEKEHVTPYIINKKNGFRLGNIKNELNVGQLRLTLDRIEDYELIKKIVKKIGKRPIFMKDVLKLFSEEPELVKINSHIPANEGMLKSLKFMKRTSLNFFK